MNRHAFFPSDASDDPTLGHMHELVAKIRAVANEICLGDLTDLGLRTTGVDRGEPLRDALGRMHDEGRATLRVRGAGRARDLVLPMERIERALATPFGHAIFMKRPVGYLLEITGHRPEGLTHTLTISEACARALSRAPAHRGDPVLVYEPDAGDDWAISVQVLLLVQSCMLQHVLAENERQRGEMIQAYRAREAMQSELMSMSRRSGGAEDAAGVLKQVGQAVRGIDRSVGQMRQRLDQLPTEPMVHVLRELGGIEDHIADLRVLTESQAGGRPGSEQESADASKRPAKPDQNAA